MPHISAIGHFVLMWMVSEKRKSNRRYLGF